MATARRCAAFKALLYSDATGSGGGVDDNDDDDVGALRGKSTRAHAFVSGSIDLSAVEMRFTVVSSGS